MSTDGGENEYLRSEREYLRVKPSFAEGDRVHIDLPRLTGKGTTITGTVVGKAMTHIIDMWIVRADDNNGHIPDADYPFHTFVCPHVVLEAA